MGRRQKKTPALKIKAGVLLCCRPPAKLIHGVQSEVQAGQYACVFASVSAAVNSVCDEQIWTQHTLFDAWKKQGVDQVHFGNIARVATEPVRDRVQAQRYCDGATPMSPDDYLKMIKGCIDAGGIAIVSFQIADSHLNRQPAWHMLSLIRRDGDNFTAWDTSAGNEMTITAAQLVTHIPYGAGALAVHNEGDVFMIRPIQVARTESDQQRDTFALKIEQEALSVGARRNELRKQNA